MEYHYSETSVEMMGGEIGVRSQEGQGSEFWFTVRLAPAEARARTIEPPRQLGAVTTLVVDDNATNRKILSRMLAKWGLPVLCAPSGSQALEILDSAHAQGALPGRIVMDMQMPGMDGLEATREIRVWEATRRVQNKEASWSRTPIIAMTAGAMAQDRARCIAADMDDYVTKPVNLWELAKALSKWLPRSEEKAAQFPERGKAEHQETDRLQKEKVDAKPAPPDLPVMNREDQLARFMGDVELVDEALHIFLQTLPERLTALRQAVAAGDNQNRRTGRPHPARHGLEPFLRGPGPRGQNPGTGLPRPPSRSPGIGAPGGTRGRTAAHVRGRILTFGFFITGPRGAFRAPLPPPSSTPRHCVSRYRN